MLELVLVRPLRGAVIGPTEIACARFLGRFIRFGLVLLWASGIAIISFAPDGPVSVLANPKLQAKLVIVVALTLNGLLIESVAVSLLERNRDGRLFDGIGEIRRTVILASAAISTVGWIAPFLLGMASELNFTTPAETILLVYCGVLAAACLGFQIGARLFYRPTVRALRRSISGTLALWLGRLSLRLIDASKEAPQTREPRVGADPKPGSEANRFHPPRRSRSSRTLSPREPGGPGRADDALLLNPPGQPSS